MISKNSILKSVFQIRRTIGLLDGPISVQWVCTHSCNLSCKHCMVDAGKSLSNELATTEIKKVVDELSQIGTRNFLVTGGEPLLREDIFEVLSYAKSKKLKVGIATNASLVSNFKDQLKLLKLDSVMISLDGLEDNHKKIRGDNNNYNEVIQAIKFFAEIKTPQISVCTTVNKLNLKELPQLRDLIFSIGTTNWSINIVLPEGRAKNQDWLFLENKEILELLKFISENKEKCKIDICSEVGYLGDWNKKIRKGDFFCGCGWTSCAIMANGDVMACPIFENNDYVVGNIRQKSFAEIWQKGFSKFQNIFLKESCNSCNHYSKCGGGCKVMRVLNANCLKESFENKP